MASTATGNIPSAADAMLFCGKTVDPDTGMLADCPGSAVNWEPLPLEPGSTLAPKPGFRCRLWAYDSETDTALIRDYSYQDEANWTRLRPDLSRGWTGPGEPPARIGQPLFARIEVSREDGSAPQAGTRLGDAVELVAVPAEPCGIPAHFADEVERVRRRVEELRGPGDLVAVVLTDIHYSTGCIWDETLRNVRAVCEAVRPDFIAQLGDITDGLTPAEVTRSMAERVLDGLRGCGVPVHCCIGNHDLNCFRGNPGRFSARESSLLYTGSETPWYHLDLGERRTRVVFLDSFDPDAKERYGFKPEQVRWLKRMVRTTPDGWSLLVFSHVPPLPHIHYWSDTIRNGGKLLEALERSNRRRGNVLGFIHGHNHVDQVCRWQTFPIVSVGCAKYEEFVKCKPKGSFTPQRALGTASQDLWDVLVAKPAEERLEFVRFGAGADRSVGCHD